MSKKYYAKFVNGVPVEGSLKSFPNNPGYPYKELSIPDCCPLEPQSIILSTEAPIGTCTGIPVIEIDNVAVVQTGPPMVNLYLSFNDYIAALNAAYAGILDFTVVSGTLIRIDVLVPFVSFRYTLSLTCE